jgi:hypothetical protein
MPRQARDYINALGLDPGGKNRLTKRNRALTPESKPSIRRACFEIPISGGRGRQKTVNRICSRRRTDRRYSRSPAFGRLGAIRHGRGRRATGWLPNGPPPGPPTQDAARVFDGANRSPAATRHWQHVGRQMRAARGSAVVMTRDERAEAAAACLQKPAIGVQQAKVARASLFATLALASCPLAIRRARGRDPHPRRRIMSHVTLVLPIAPLRDVDVDVDGVCGARSEQGEQGVSEGL